MWGAYFWIYKCDVVVVIKMGAYIHGLIIFYGCLSRFTVDHIIRSQDKKYFSKLLTSSPLAPFSHFSLSFQHCMENLLTLNCECPKKTTQFPVSELVRINLGGQSQAAASDTLLQFHNPTILMHFLLRTWPFYDKH